MRPLWAWESAFWEGCRLKATKPVLDSPTWSSKGAHIISRKDGVGGAFGEEGSSHEDVVEDCPGMERNVQRS